MEEETPTTVERRWIKYTESQVKSLMLKNDTKLEVSTHVSFLGNCFAQSIQAMGSLSCIL
jgi:hypothetical protein